MACHEGEGFLKYTWVKLPDKQNSWFNETTILEECRKMCLEIGSCMSYANLDIPGEGTGCLLLFGYLIDIREFSEGGQDIYVRMASSVLAVPVPQDGSNEEKRQNHCPHRINNWNAPAMSESDLVCLAKEAETA